MSTAVHTSSSPSRLAGRDLSSIGSIGRAELPFLAWFTLALCLLTTLPYAVGYLYRVPGTAFTGIIEHSYDTGNYLAYTHQSAVGHWIFHNPMTPEPHRAVFFNLEWLVIGKLSALFHLSLAAATGVVRLLCLILMCVSVYWLAAFLFSSIFLRRVAVVAAMAGGGFGWIVSVHLLHIPINSSYFLDLTNANLFPFYWALKLPHFLISESFVVLGLCLFLYAEQTGSPRQYLAAALSAMAAGASRPYDMLFFMAAVTLFLAISYLIDGVHRSPLWLRALAVYACVPLLIYYFWIFKLHPVFRWWSLPGNPAPPIWLLAIAFGMTAVLLPFALWRLLRHGKLGPPARLMLCAATVAAVFAHLHSLLHFSFQFATNLFIPLVMIVVLGLEEPILSWRRSRGTLLIIALLFVNSLTSIAIAGQAVVLVLQGDFRIDTQLLDAYSWLNQNSSPRDIVFADLDHSNQIPGYSENTVYCGYLNAVNLEEKEKAVQRFLDPQTSNDVRRQFLLENHVRYLLLTPDQVHALPDLNSFLRTVFSNNAATIYALDVPQ